MTQANAPEPPIWHPTEKCPECGCARGLQQHICQTCISNGWMTLSVVGGGGPTPAPPIPVTLNAIKNKLVVTHRAFATPMSFADPDSASYKAFESLQEALADLGEYILSHSAPDRGGKPLPAQIGFDGSTWWDADPKPSESADVAAPVKPGTVTTGDLKVSGGSSESSVMGGARSPDQTTVASANTSEISVVGEAELWPKLEAYFDEAEKYEVWNGTRSGSTTDYLPLSVIDEDKIMRIIRPYLRIIEPVSVDHQYTKEMIEKHADRADMFQPETEVIETRWVKLASAGVRHE